METAPPTARSRFRCSRFALLYGGMTCTAGVLGSKQVGLGPLAVEAGIFPFLMLVAISSAVAELYGRATADRLVRFGFIPLTTAIVLTWIVIQLPTDPGMYPPAQEAFPIILGQSARLMVAGIISYGVSMTLNVFIFAKLATAREGRLVAVRGAVASILSQIVDTMIFITIGFLGTRPIGDLILGQALAKVVLSIMFVPPLIALLVGSGPAPGMKFGIFDHVDDDGQSLARQLEDRLQMAEAYDRCGFYAYHVAEHHGTPLGRAPSPSVLLAAMAQRTTRLKFGPLVYLLPIYHPLRLIEEVAMLDSALEGAAPAWSRARGLADRDGLLRRRDGRPAGAVRREPRSAAQGPDIGRADPRRTVLQFRPRADAGEAGPAAAPAAVVRRGQPGFDQAGPRRKGSTSSPWPMASGCRW